MAIIYFKDYEHNKLLGEYEPTYEEEWECLVDFIIREYPLNRTILLKFIKDYDLDMYSLLLYEEDGYQEFREQYFKEKCIYYER